MLGVTTAREDAVFEVASMVMNAGLWFMKHAAMLAARPEPAMEEAKEVHTCLRKAAGLVKFVQDTLVPQLSEKTVDGGDLDGRVCTAYTNQVDEKDSSMPRPHIMLTSARRRPRRSPSPGPLS